MRHASFIFIATIWEECATDKGDSGGGGRPSGRTSAPADVEGASIDDGSGRDSAAVRVRP